MEVAGDPVISMRPQRPPSHSTIARLKGCGEKWQVGTYPCSKGERADDSARLGEEGGWSSGSMERMQVQRARGQAGCNGIEKV